MNILIVGQGHMGKILEKGLPSATLCQKRIQEMTRLDVQPFDVVVNTAAKTDLPWCEEHPMEAFEENVIAAVKLGRLAANEGIPLIHLSSGCIWKGPYNSYGTPFRPTSLPDPACFYSWTKVAAEGILMNEKPTALHILRPRQVYSDSPSPRNTLFKLNTYKKLLDTPNSMTSVDTIKKCILGIIKDSETLNQIKVWNLYDIGVTSPYQVGMLLHEAGLREKPELLEKKDLDTWHKPQRVDAVMEDIFMEKFVEPPMVQDELRRVIALFAVKLKG